MISFASVEHEIFERINKYHQDVLTDRGRDNQGSSDIEYEVSHIFIHGISIIEAAISGVMLSSSAKEVLAVTLKSNQKSSQDQTGETVQNSLRAAKGIYDQSEKNKITLEEGKKIIIKLIKKITDEYGFHDQGEKIIRALWKDRKLSERFGDWNPFES